jgi:hypothetical protein
MASMTMEQQEGQVKEAIQAPLIPDAGVQAVEPTGIDNDRIAATYLGLSLSRDKDRKLVSLDFSFVLTDEHHKYIPAKVAEAQDFLVDTDNKMVGVNHLKPHTVDVFKAPNAKKSELHLVGADLTKASVTMVEETGKGITKKVIRFKFSILVERDEEIIDFGAWNDEQEFWLTMEQTQRVLAA